MYGKLYSVYIAHRTLHAPSKP